MVLGWMDGIRGASSTAAIIDGHRLGMGLDGPLNAPLL